MKSVEEIFAELAPAAIEGARRGPAAPAWSRLLPSAALWQAYKERYERSSASRARSLARLVGDELERARGDLVP